MEGVCEPLVLPYLRIRGWERRPILLRNPIRGARGSSYRIQRSLALATCPFKLVQRKKPAGKPAAARIGRSTTRRSCGRTVAQDLCRGLGLARPGVETSLDAAARSACAPNAADL